MQIITPEILKFVTSMYNKYLEIAFNERANFKPSDLFVPKEWNPLYFILRYFPQYIYQEQNGKVSFIEGWQVHVCRFISERATTGRFPIKIYVCGGKYIGKTVLEALLILWYIHTTKGRHGRYIAFSGREQQLKSVLFRTLTTIVDDPNGAGRLIAHARPEGDRFYIKHHPKEEKPKKNLNDHLLASTCSKHSPDNVSGVHANYILYVVDEAQAVPNNIFPFWEGIYADPHTISIMCGNGTIYDSTFCTIVRENKTYVDDTMLALQVSVNHCLRDTIDHQKILKTYERYDEKFYADVFYYGKIVKPENSEFFNLEKLNDAISRGRKYLSTADAQRFMITDPMHYITGRGNAPRSIIAIDVSAGAGRAATVMVRRTDQIIEIIYYSKDATTHDLRNFLVEYVTFYGGKSMFDIFIDGDGVGYAVAMDLQKNDGLRPKIIHSNVRPNKLIYDCLRTYFYVAFKNWLMHNDSCIILHQNLLDRNVIQTLMQEANEIYLDPESPVYGITKKKDLKRSPDILDAIAYSFYDTKELFEYSL